MNNVMTVSKAKDTYIQVRIHEDLKDDVQTTANARGLTMSGLIHSLLVQAIRTEKDQYPEIFKTQKITVLKEPAGSADKKRTKNPDV